MNLDDMVILYALIRKLEKYARVELVWGEESYNMNVLLNFKELIGDQMRLREDLT